jgi:hypothetical protein
MDLPAHSGPRPLIRFRNHFTQTVALLGRVIIPSQGLYLNTGQHKQNKRIDTPNIHALSGFRAHNPSVRTDADGSSLRWPIHIRVWLASPARRGPRLGLISPHTYERGDPHPDEFGSLEPEPRRTREPDSYVCGPL